MPRASRFAVDLDRHWRNSSKIDALMSDLQATLAAPLPPPFLPAPPARPGKPAPPAPVAKVCIFSQWTAMLDLVERPLRAAGLHFVRRDQSLTRSMALAQPPSMALAQTPSMAPALTRIPTVTAGLHFVRLDGSMALPISPLYLPYTSPTGWTARWRCPRARRLTPPLTLTLTLP